MTQIITKENYNEILQDNLRERSILITKAKDNLDLQRLIVKKCEDDPIYFFEYFLYTDKNNDFFDEYSPQSIPFLPFEFQKEFIVDVIDCIFTGKNVFIEKSRQMWITWMLMWVMVYLWLFHDKKGFIVSRTQAEIDTRWDISSCFEKLRFMCYMMPQWMLPEDFSKEWWTDYNKSMSISKKETNASMTWRAASPDAWRWWTYDYAFMDELSFMQNAMWINKALWRACRSRIINSTPNWEWNEYFRMRQLALNEIALVEAWELPKEKMRFSFHRLHWSEHPFYDKDWYDSQCRESTPEQIAQELDINYNVAIVWRVYPEFKSPTVQFWLFDYDPNLPLYISIDNSHWGMDSHAIIVAQTEMNWTYIRIVDSVELNSTIDQVASMLWKQPESWFMMNDLVAEFYERYMWYKKATFIADPYDTNSTWNNTSISKIYRKYGIHLLVPELLRGWKGNIVEQIRLTRTNLHKLKVNEECTEFISAIQNARYPHRIEGSNGTTSNNKPIHDWTSHFRTSLEYLFLYLMKQEEVCINKIKRSERKKVMVEYWDPITGQSFFREQ